MKNYSDNVLKSTNSMDLFKNLYTIIDCGIKNQEEEITLNIPTKSGMTDEKMQELMRFYQKYKGIIKLLIAEDSGISHQIKKVILADLARHNKKMVERRETLKQKENGINNTSSAKKIMFQINPVQAEPQKEINIIQNSNHPKVERKSQQEKSKHQKPIIRLEEKLDEFQESPEIAELKIKASQNDSAAQYELAKRYEIGMGIKRDDNKALKLYQLSSSDGYSKAENKMGEIYEQGLLGVEKSLDKAKNYFCLASDHQYDKGVLNCARLYFSEYYEFNFGSDVVFADQTLRKFDSLLNELVSLANKGYSEAQYYLAVYREKGFYWNGKHEKHGKHTNTFYFSERDKSIHYDPDVLILREDLTEVVYNLEHSASQGFVLAQFKLGLAYEAGFYGLEKNFDKAFRLLEKAAKIGHTGAQCVLHYMLSLKEYENTDVVKTFKAAAFKFPTAEITGDIVDILEDAFNIINKPLIYSTLGKKQEIFRDLATLALSNHGLAARAQLYLSLCFEKGYGITKHLDLAQFWLKQSVQNADVTVEKILTEDFYFDKKLEAEQFKKEVKSQGEQLMITQQKFEMNLLKASNAPANQSQVQSNIMPLPISPSLQPTNSDLKQTSKHKF